MIRCVVDRQDEMDIVGADGHVYRGRVGNMEEKVKSIVIVAD